MRPVVIGAAAVALFLGGCLHPVEQNPGHPNCPPPPPDTFLATGLDLDLAQATWRDVTLGGLETGVTPSVISLATAAQRDGRLRDYLRCLAIHRDGLPVEMAIYLESQNAFLATSPDADQFMSWRRENPPPQVVIQPRLDRGGSSGDTLDIEPNDTPDQGQVLAVGASASGRLGDPGDEVDWYTLSPDEAGSFRFTLTNTLARGEKGVLKDAALLGPDGRKLEDVKDTAVKAGETASSRHAVQLSAGATYRIRVEYKPRFGPVEYRLSTSFESTR